MQIERIPCGPLSVNSYVVWQERGGQAVVIDPADAASILSFLNDRELTLSHILLTHGHVDHILGVAELKDATNADIYIHEADANMLLSEDACLAKSMYLHIQPIQADRLLHDEDVIEAAGISFRVLHTPGHTPGGCCFVAEDVLFTGDTLFRLSIGRFDFPGSSESELMNSIGGKLLNLSSEYRLLPGHMQPSTLSFEREHNPYIRNLTELS